MIKRMTALLLILLLSLALPACASAERDDAMGGAAYTDVPADAWYADAVNTVSGQALMTGTGEGVFSPDAPFTRAQLTTVLYR
ncbi:MAG: S-layer homology domain-containing protein, partial [Clostridia bacterium]|nr:S-layer homology domain-containing protein [Clostridia bacterium]